MAWSFENEEAAENVIENIRNGKISNSATAYGILNQIINDFPDSLIAQEAKELRDSL